MKINNAAAPTAIHRTSLNPGLIFMMATSPNALARDDALLRFGHPLSRCEEPPPLSFRDSHPARPRARSSGLLGLPMRRHGNVVPLLPVGDSLPVFVLDHLQRPGTEAA